MKKSKKIIGRKNALIFYSLWMIVPMLHFVIFYVGVNFNSIILAFKVYDYELDRYVVTFRNFADFFRDLFTYDVLGVVFKNSLVLYFWGAVIGVSFALVFAFYIYKKFIGSGFFKVVLFLPSIISSMAMALIFLVFADVAIPDLVRSVTGKELTGLMIIGSDTVFPTIIFYNIWISFGIAMLMYSSAMSRIPEDIIEYSKIDGVSYARELFGITIPLIGSTLQTFIVVGIAGIFTNQANVLAFFPTTEDRNIQTIGFYLFSSVSRGMVSKYPYLAAGGLIFTLLTFPLTFGMQLLLSKIIPEVEY